VTARQCRVEKYLTAYADGELRPRLRRKIERHLEACTPCARELDSIVASDRILKAAAVPRVSDARWRAFSGELAHALDRVDRESSGRAAALPVCGRQRRRVALAFAGACAVVVLLGLTLWPARLLTRRTAGNECIVDSIETYAAGYTPMFFSSDDPEMTVIWVFSGDAGNGPMGEGPGSR
jgi:anti-sigma factor RsiW